MGLGIVIRGLRFDWGAGAEVWSGGEIRIKMKIKIKTWI